MALKSLTDQSLRRQIFAAPSPSPFKTSFSTQSLKNRLIIRLEARLQPIIGFYFMARFGGVHVFGYNSAESEPIWIKSGAL